jgi:hypothetical protein
VNRADRAEPCYLAAYTGGDGSGGGRLCTRETASGLDRTAGVGEMNTPGRALSQKALVGKSPAFGNAGLASSPKGKRYDNDLLDPADAARFCC